MMIFCEEGDREHGLEAGGRHGGDGLLVPLLVVTPRLLVPRVLQTGVSRSTREAATRGQCAWMVCSCSSTGPSCSSKNNSKSFAIFHLRGGEGEGKRGGAYRLIHEAVRDFPLTCSRVIMQHREPGCTRDSSQSSSPQHAVRTDSAS
jgi:hypothetical protein